MNSRLRGNLMLLLTAFIWGTAFVAQSVGADFVGPFTFICVRSILGGLVLLPVIFVLDKAGITQKPQTRADKKTLLTGGICCGAALAIASVVQQMGVERTTVGKAGFITALYILIVPMIGLFLKKKVGKLVWIGVGLALVGMYLLCITESFTIGFGDLLVLICSFCYSIHIMVIDHFSPKADGVRLSCIQFFTAAVISGIFMLLFETPSLEGLRGAAFPIAYAGIMSSGVAYTLQVVAQKDTDPTVASMLMSLESVFALLAGWVLLNQALSVKEMCGALLVFCAIILAQLPEKKKA
ncbi:MAG: DMT family transporter [Oscillospiraceae bacterium]|nr:DMT family transporter [Oscillospiraceae bacterium]